VAGLTAAPTSAAATDGRRSARLDLTAYAREAGFTDVETLPIDHDMFRFYRLIC